MFGFYIWLHSCISVLLPVYIRKKVVIHRLNFLLTLTVTLAFSVMAEYQPQIKYYYCWH